MRRLRQRRSAHLVAVSGGVRLPCEVEGPDGPLALVVGHGLGSSDPSVKSHRHDAIRHIILPVLSQIGCRAAFYTARGHGDSLGGMGRGEEQFAWPRLAEDLLAVADATIGPGSRFVAAGNSMGAVTALCAALQQPSQPQGQHCLAVSHVAARSFGPTAPVWMQLVSGAQSGMLCSRAMQAAALDFWMLCWLRSALRPLPQATMCLMRP